MRAWPRAIGSGFDIEGSQLPPNLIRGRVLEAEYATEGARMLRTGLLGILIGSALLAAGCGREAAPKPAGVKAPAIAAPAPKAAAPAAPVTEGKNAVNGKAEIAWNYDFVDGMAKTKAAGKPAMVDVFATWCGPCKLLDESVFSRPDVAEASKAFTTIRVDGDKYPDIVTKLGVSGYPTVVFLSSDGKEIGRSVGAVPYQNMLDAMKKAQEKARG